MKLPGGGYAPKDDTQPGTPPEGPAGASSARDPESTPTCACGKPCDHVATEG